MRIAICDDDEKELKKTAGYVRNFLNQQMIEVELDCFISGEQFLSDYQPGQYTLIFLDIYMDRLSGIETAQTLRDLGETCELIFITTSTDHALESYHLKALEYLLKPVTQEAVQAAIQRCFHTFTEAQRYILIECEHRGEKIYCSSIFWIEVYAHYCYVHTITGIFKTRMSLKQMEQKLPHPPFYRISKNQLVNFKEVEQPEQGGLKMKNGAVVPIPKHPKYEKAVLSMYKDYLLYHP